MVLIDHLFTKGPLYRVGDKKVFFGYRVTLGHSGCWRLALAPTGTDLAHHINFYTKPYMLEVALA